MSIKTNETIIVAAKSIPGLSNLVLKNKDVQSYSGLLFDVWKEIARANNFSYKVILGDNEIVGSPINNTGNWSGMIGMLLRGDADIIVAPVSVTAQRAQVIEFSMPLYEDASCLLTSATSDKGANRYFTIFRPFDYTVWLCLLGLILSYSAFLYIIHHFLTSKDSNYQKYLKNNRQQVHNSSHSTSYGMYIFFMFGKVLMEDVNMQYLIYHISERVIMFFWWVFAIIINSLYTSVLVSLLVVTKYEPEINSVEELARLKKFSLCLQAGGYQIEYFNKATNPNYKLIYKYIQEHQNEMQYINVASSIFEQAYQGTCFGFVDHMVGRILLSTVKANNVSCVDYWAPASIAFAYRKNWIHADSISSTLAKLHENGLISLIIRNYLNPLLRKQTTQVNQKKIMTLDNLFSIFVIHAGITGLAILYQIIEIILKRGILRSLFSYLFIRKERKCETETRNITRFSLSSFINFNFNKNKRVIVLTDSRQNSEDSVHQLSISSLSRVLLSLKEK